MVGLLSDRPSSRWNSANTASTVDGLRCRPVLLGFGGNEPTAPLNLGPPPLYLDLSNLDGQATRDAATIHVAHVVCVTDVDMVGGGVNERDWQARLRRAGSKQRRRSLVERI